MPPALTILLALSYILSLATAIPAPGASSYTDGNGGQHVAFPSGWPTCGNDKSMAPFSTTITVDTRQDCDPVIDTICRAAAAQQAQNLGHANGTCEGHIIFPGSTTAVTYADCVLGFQSITETCMLLDGPKNYAAVGKQFGLKNLQYFGAAQTDFPGGQVATWTANSADPGYLMGPPNVFGTDFHAVDADDVLGGS